jgi:hypothetical protein
MGGKEMTRGMIITIFRRRAISALYQNGDTHPVFFTKELIKALPEFVETENTSCPEEDIVSALHRHYSPITDLNQDGCCGDVYELHPCKEGYVDVADLINSDPDKPGYLVDFLYYVSCDRNGRVHVKICSDLYSGERQIFFGTMSELKEWQKRLFEAGHAFRIIGYDSVNDVYDEKGNWSGTKE